jgi:putative ATPase
VISVIQGDLTAQEVDAIVNAANESLHHGGGVAAAILRAGGSSIQTESDAWVKEHGEVGPGTAATTGAGRLPARWVIHVVGPRYRSGQDNAHLLSQAVGAALDAAVAIGARTVAMPAISAGVFGYPRTEACAVIVAATSAWLEDHPGVIDDVRLVGYDQGTAAAFAAALAAGGRPVTDLPTAREKP